MKAKNTHMWAKAEPKRVRLWLLLLLTLSLGACGRRNAAGALEVTVTGLPAGIAAAVEVVGPNGFAQRLLGSGTLGGLVVGSYTVTALPVSGEAGTYTGTVSGSPVTLVANTTTPVSVTYGGGGVGTGGTISGTVSVVDAAETAAETADASAGGAAAFVPGEVIVKFKPGLRTQSLAQTGLEPLRDLALQDVELYRLAGRMAPTGLESGTLRTLTLRAQTLQTVAELAAREDVEYAHPNYLLEAYAEPNDPLYTAQWHLRAINLPTAWNQTTGSADVTVAVVDSGILPDHPDLSGKLAPGYDFVGDSFSGDGDGRDADPTDPEGSFHGSHVAGTIAASTNNGVGVAGVSWGARILPVRVLGADSGTLADAIDGVLWSVGESVPGVPANANPADVLNLSLGGPFLCGDVPALQDALSEAVGAGATVVVAAGNDDSDASYFTPASCGGVIAVGATTQQNTRAGYSNFGERIDVMAPGGELSRDSDGDGNPDGVLSTVAGAVAGSYGYSYFEGTSMASPHVAGVVALLKSLRPELTNAEVRDILTSTAQPITHPSCADGCGAGLIDAAAALGALETPVPADFTLSLSPATLSLTAGESAEVSVLVDRSGSFTADVSFSVSGLPVGLSAGFAPPATGGDSATLTLAAATDLSGTYTLQVQGVGGGVSETATLSVVVSGVESPPTPDFDVAGTYVFYCGVSQTTCQVTEDNTVVITASGSSAPYTLEDVPAGSYGVYAWNDLNDNGQLDDNEPFGVYPNAQSPAAVTPPANDVDIEMVPALSTQTPRLPVRPSVTGSLGR